MVTDPMSSIRSVQSSKYNTVSLTHCLNPVSITRKCMPIGSAQQSTTRQRVSLLQRGTLAGSYLQ